MPSGWRFWPAPDCSLPGQCQCGLDDVVGEPTPMPADMLNGLSHRVQFPAPFGVEKHARV